MTNNDKFYVDKAKRNIEASVKEGGKLPRMVVIHSGWHGYRKEEVNTVVEYDTCLRVLNIRALNNRNKHQPVKLRLDELNSVVHRLEALLPIIAEYEMVPTPADPALCPSCGLGVNAGAGCCSDVFHAL